MSMKFFRGAIAALSAVALLTACTPSDGGQETTRKDAAKAEASPDPVFRIHDVKDSGESKDKKDDKDSENKAAEESAGPSEGATPAATGTASSQPSEAPEGEIVTTGSTVDFTSGRRLGLGVEGGVLTNISVTDKDHPRISVDPGMFFDTTGAELEPGTTEAESDTAASAAESEGSESSTESPATSETGSPSADPSTDSSSPSASADSQDGDDQSAEAAERVSAPEESAGWVSDYDLIAGSTYEVTATATTPDGKDHEFTSTVKVKDTDASAVSVRSILADDQTVGVAAPIILTFGSTVAKKYRDDVERRLSVEVTDKDGKERKVEGSWGWLPDDPESRLHFRPKEYWPAHSKVSVDIPLKNVPTGKDRVGENDLSLDFEIGREQIVEASAKTHRMTVERDGKEVMDFPASLGSAKAPSYNGTHVVMSKSADYTMTSERWNYSTPVQWAVRIHNNGEFVHAAPWSAGSQGSANVSHGCINLTTSRAKKYYDSAIYGDPVIIKDSSVDLSTDASDISDWVYSWDEWKKLSALD